MTVKQDAGRVYGRIEPTVHNVDSLAQFSCTAPVQSSMASLPMPYVGHLGLEKQMRTVALLFVLLVGSTQAIAQNVSNDPKNSTITADMQTVLPHIGGRVVTEALPKSLPVGAMSYRHEWPGVYFEADFTGDTIFAKFDDPANEYRVLIDDLPPITIAQPGASEVTIGGISNANHHIRLEKVTESAWIVGAFDGFYLPKGETGTSAAPRQRQIEFIGDSDMTGYGVRSSGHVCTQDEVRLLSDTQIAYPALLAKALNADYQVNAISGRGLIRNFGGGTDHALPSVYANSLPDLGPGIDLPPYQNTLWKPDLIVVALGGNDFSTPLVAGEDWQTNDQLIDDFIVEYTRFLTTLHDGNPDAALLLVQFEIGMLAGDDLTRIAEFQQTALPEIARAIGFRSANTVSIFAMATDATACHYHASQADHQRRADWLTAYVAGQPALWQGNGG